MQLVILVIVVIAALVHSGACAQVFVKFLTPPHGYTHSLQLDTRGGGGVGKEERLYPREPQRGYRFRPQAGAGRPHEYSRPRSYYYPRPAKPFEEYGVPSGYSGQYQGEQAFPPPPHPGFPPGRFSGGVGPGPGPDIPPPEPYLPSGEYMNPAVIMSQHHTEVSYDPLLITGRQAAQYVSYLFSRGELFFHLIPHERLVLMNQRERVENNLLPHLLASIRPGHPFFYHR